MGKSGPLEQIFWPTIIFDERALGKFGIFLDSELQRWLDLNVRSNYTWHVMNRNIVLRIEDPSIAIRCKLVWSEWLAV